MIEIILISVLLIVLIVCFIAIKRLADKITIYEQYVEYNENFTQEIKDRLNIAYEIMKQADVRGSFEADDEIGDAFKTMKQAVDDVNSFVTTAKIQGTFEESEIMTKTQ